MSSSVFFKFKSQKEPQRITFDGTGISVFELKRDVINISRLGDGTDFDLAIYDPDTNKEYDDDTTIVSRGTTVVARRLPASKPGAGRAARYVSGKMPVMAKNQHRVEATKFSAPTTSTAFTNGPMTNNAMSEEDKIAAMFAAGGEQWEQQQQQMANQKAIHRTGFQKQMPVPDKPLPPGYTCHRCGEKGHWIQACPTNNDPTFDGRPKFRRTTGIPRSFLKVVEKPAALAEDGTVDVSKLPAGVMYTSTGEWVVAEPDKASWDQFQAKAKASAEKAENMSLNSQELRDQGLECQIDKRLFVDPVKTPCCGQTYCRDCIENALLEHDFVCPGCSTESVLVDNLVPDEDMVVRIKTYAESKLKAAKEVKEKSASPKPEQEAKSPGATSQKSPVPKAATAVNGSTSKTATPEPKSESKKRPAEDELDNKRIPTGPAAMRTEQSQAPVTKLDDQNFIQQMNAMAGMPAGQQAMSGFGFPGMGFPNGMMGMPGMNPMMGMPGMMNSGWGGMGPMNGMPNNMYGGFNPMMGNGGFNQHWQGNQGWNNGNGQNQMMGNGNANGNDGGAYMRQPVNPNRHQARNNRRQRSVDYREM